MSKEKHTLSWDKVEKKIKEEMDWLDKSIETMFGASRKNDPITCKRCLLRSIAVLIVTGSVKATEINKKEPSKGFWLTKKKIKKGLTHGGDWHRQTIAQVEDHFIKQGYQMVREPNFHWGRADLGAYKKDKADIIIEIGTTSFFKLWMNLQVMRNCTYLIIPNDDKIIEFVRDKATIPQSEFLKEFYYNKK